MDYESRIELLQEQMLCVGPIYMFRYDAEGTLKSSNCPEEAAVDAAFGALGCRERMLTYSQGTAAPLWIGSPVGVEWMAASETENGERSGFCVLGPCLNAELTVIDVERALREFQSLRGAQAWAKPLLAVIKRVPVLMQVILVQNIKLLQCAVAGKSISASDIRFCTAGEKAAVAPGGAKKNRMHVYLSERALLKMVHDGDLNYRGVYNQTNNISNGVPVKGGDPLRQAKTSVIVFTSLCVREAIEGGLSPDLAYTVGDMYIQNVENSRNLNEIAT